MYCYLQEVRKRIRESVARLHRDIPEIRIGVMAVGDYVRVFGFSVVLQLVVFDCIFSPCSSSSSSSAISFQAM